MAFYKLLFLLGPGFFVLVISFYFLFDVILVDFINCCSFSALAALKKYGCAQLSLLARAGTELLGKKGKRTYCGPWEKKLNRQKLLVNKGSGGGIVR